MKVLIVDDEGDIRRVARLALERIGRMQVVDAGSSAEALGKAEEESPDVILLDVMMPGTDGPTTLAALRANPKTSAIPVVFLTAKAMKGEIERLRALGAAGVLTKPFDPASLPAELRRVLGRTDS